MRWKCKCAYDGTSFYGWQSQEGGNTIQDILEETLKNIFKEPVRIHGSSRTDSGVHAREQVFHFDADWAHSESELLGAMSTSLVQGLQVYDLQKVDDDFHARFSAKGKVYEYTIYLGYASPFDVRYCWSYAGKSLSVDRMKEAARCFLGKHDFSAFSVRFDKSSNENPIKELNRLDVVVEGKWIRIKTEGSGYLYKMVRMLVGALVEVGRNNLDSNDLENMLTSGIRTKNITVAPAKGLFLEHVYY